MSQPLFEQLFGKGTMLVDPQRKVGVLNMERIAKFPEIRKTELAKFHWLVGDWNAANSVRATRVSPAYTDVYPYSYALCEDDTVICGVRAGKQRPYITYDPFSERFVMTMPGGGAYGMLLSPLWKDDKIEFAGRILMLGVECELRVHWTKRSHNEFYVVNHERLDRGWVEVDDFVYRRIPSNLYGAAESKP